MEIRPQVAPLIEAPRPTPAEKTADHDVLTVSPATRRVAYAYEHFRNILEPDEADILRRKAIVRILERRLAEKRPPQVTAEQLLQELMRANYIPPATKGFARFLARYIERTGRIRQRLPEKKRHWFLSIAAVSIDRLMYPSSQSENLVSLMYRDTHERTEWIDSLVKEKDRPTQLYIACHRVLLESDDYEIAYHYFIHRFPSWHQADFNLEDENSLLKDLPEFYSKIQAAVHHPSRGRLTRLLRPAAVPYRILRDIVSDNPESLADGEALEEAAKNAVQKRSRRLKNRMASRAWHSVLFLFMTKTIIALLLEVPYELLLISGLHWGALAINIAFHPVLLFTLTSTVRLPGHDNTQKIIEEVKKVVSGEEVFSTIILSRTRSYGTATWSLFALVYIVLFFAIFWGMFMILDLLQFSLVAMFMFVMFLGLVSFLAIRIRRSVNQIRVIPQREGALTALITFITLPILEFGRWLAEHLNQFNIALIFMDRILEAPFKIFIDVSEEWFAFLRERREEIV